MNNRSERMLSGEEQLDRMPDWVRLRSAVLIQSLGDRVQVDSGQAPAPEQARKLAGYVSETLPEGNILFQPSDHAVVINILDHLAPDQSTLATIEVNRTFVSSLRLEVIDAGREMAREFRSSRVRARNASFASGIGNNPQRLPGPRYI